MQIKFFVILSLFLSFQVFGQDKNIICEGEGATQLCQHESHNHNEQQDCGLDNKIEIPKTSDELFAQQLNDYVEPRIQKELCSDTSVWGTSGKSEQEIKQIKKDLVKQCRNKAKLYKKAVVKEKLKKFQLFQAAQAIFKRSKKLIKKGGKEGTKNSGFKNTLNFTIPGIDPKALGSLKGKSKDEINKIIENAIRKQYPNIDEIVARTKGDQNLKNSFHVSETVPVNVQFTRDKNTTCQITSKDFPTYEPDELNDCETCKGDSISASFSLDCSFMADSDLSQDKAEGYIKKYLKARGENDILNQKPGAGHKKFCQKDLSSIPESEKLKNKEGLDKLRRMADSLCDIAKDGGTPDFLIETTRNRFQDHTPQLAHKRGVFSQGFLFETLKENIESGKCDLSTIAEHGITPQWLNDFEHFNEVVKVETPVYGIKGKNFDGVAQGDYGPNPYLNPEESQKIEDEIVKYEQNFFSEKAALVTKKKELEEQLETLKQEIIVIETNVTKSKGHYSKIRKKVETPQKYSNKEFDNIDQNVNDMEAIGNQALNFYAELDDKKQQIKYKENSLEGINNRLQNDYTPAKINAKVDALKKWYSTPVNQRDEKLQEIAFGEFKMTRISGTVHKDTNPNDGFDEFSPDVKQMMSAIMKMETFTCTIDDFETYKFTPKVALRGLVKFGTIVASPIAASIAGGAVVAITPFTTIGSFFCSGCGKRGRIPPKWYLNTPNLRHLFNKQMRKEGGKVTKKAVKGWFKLHTKIKVDSDTHMTENSLNEYAQKVYGKNYEEMTDPEFQQLMEDVLERTKKKREYALASLLDQSGKCSASSMEKEAILTGLGETKDVDPAATLEGVDPRDIENKE